MRDHELGQVAKTSKLTTVVRSDLSAGYKVPQSIHSVVSFAIEHPDEFVNLNKHSNYLCCLESDEGQIEKLIDKLDLLKIKYSKFFEPDIKEGSQFTAVTVEALDEKTHK